MTPAESDLISAMLANDSAGTITALRRVATERLTPELTDALVSATVQFIEAKERRAELWAKVPNAVFNVPGEGEQQVSLRDTVDKLAATRIAERKMSGR